MREARFLTVKQSGTGAEGLPGDHAVAQGYTTWRTVIRLPIRQGQRLI
jgi:hypothetical protein